MYIHAGLLTVLVKIENVVKNYPMISNDSEVCQPLTPNDFIFQRKLEMCVTGSTGDEKIPVTLKNVERSLKYFWKQWREEDVTSL